MLYGIAVDYAWNAGFQLGFSVRQISTGLQWDFSTSAFVPVASAAQPVSGLLEGKVPFAGMYSGGIPAPLPPAFVNGDYRIGIHFAEPPNSCFECWRVAVSGGSDQTVFPGPLTGTVTANPSQATS